MGMIKGAGQLRDREPRYYHYRVTVTPEQSNLAPDRLKALSLPSFPPHKSWATPLRRHMSLHTYFQSLQMIQVCEEHLKGREKRIPSSRIIALEGK